MNIDDLNEEIEQQDIAREVLSMHQSKKTLIYALHVQLNQFELHLDNITHKYKAISLIWLLATFVAIGFLFSSESKAALQTNRLLSVSAICLFGIIGVSSLWYIDISTFQKFWAVFFVEGIKMENKHKFLLKIGDISLSLDTVKGRIRAHENFYIFANLLLLISGGIALVLFFKSAILQVIVCFITIVFAFYLVKLMRQVGRKLQQTIEAMVIRTTKKQSR